MLVMLGSWWWEKYALGLLNEDLSYNRSGIFEFSHGIAIIAVATKAML